MQNKYKIIVLLLLIVTGIGLQLSGLLEPKEIIAFSRQYADQWWLMILLVVVQAVLFTFALAGSLFLWVAAALYPPLTASIILAAGAALGGLSAYFFSQRLTAGWIERVQTSKVYSMLRQNDNFFILLAMRLMPAFPHSVVNYSSGILKVNVFSFLVAALIGVATKSYVFSTVIYQAATSGSVYDLLDIYVLSPLIVLSLIMFFAALLINRFYFKQSLKK
ncbi:MAG: VTT domain-containing protein [Gammaproteobacteria bacterium]|nr:VTT domain-containing protein [Gammaproteobacteria bacterium]